MSYAIEMPSFIELKSIYIPRVFENITYDKIKYVFEVLELGKVSHIDLINKDSISGTKMAFVHFEDWYTNPAAQNLAEKILDPSREARLVYDDPWYWILLPNNKPIPQQFKQDNVQERQVPTESIEQLNYIIAQYKSKIDDLEAQLEEKETRNFTVEPYIDDDVVSSITQMGSCSSWELYDADDTKSKLCNCKGSSTIPAPTSDVKKQEPIKILNQNHFAFIPVPENKYNFWYNCQSIKLEF